MAAPGKLKGRSKEAFHSGPRRRSGLLLSLNREACLLKVVLPIFSLEWLGRSRGAILHGAGRAVARHCCCQGYEESSSNGSAAALAAELHHDPIGQRFKLQIVCVTTLVIKVN